MKTAASTKVATQLVIEHLNAPSRRELLELTSDNRLLLTIETTVYSKTKAKVREVTLTESFEWFQQSEETHWWLDGSPGDAWPIWLGMVSKNLVQVTADKSKTEVARSAESLLVRQCNEDRLWICNGVLTLNADGKWRTVSILEALRWLAGSIDVECSVSSDPCGEFEFYHMLAQGIFVPLNEGEVAAVRLCARECNGDLGEWAKGWISAGLEADLEEACPHCKAEAASV